MKSKIGVFGGMLLLGGGIAVWGASGIVLSQLYQVEVTQIALLLTLMSAGRLISVYFSGILCDKIGYSKGLMLGITLVSISYFAAFLQVPLYMLQAIVFFSGMGHGIMDTGSAGVLIAAYGDKAGSYFNYIQFYYGIGSFLLPTIFLMAKNSAIEIGYYFLLQFIVGAVLVILLVGDRQKSVVVPRHKDEVAVKFRLKLSMIPVLLIGFLYSGINVVLQTWLTPYYSNISPSSSPEIIITVYSIGLMLGAIICKFATDRYAFAKVLPVMCAVGAVLWIMVLAFDNLAVMMIAIMGCGIALGGLYTVGLAMLVMKTPHFAGAITGIFATVASLGSILVSLLFNYLMRIVDVEIGIVFVTVPFVLLFVCAVLCRKEERVLL